MEKSEWRIIQRSKKTGTIIKTISLDEDIAEHLSKQPNVSDYIRKLVKQDMDLPAASEGDFRPGEPLYRIYAEAKMFWRRKRGIDITLAYFGGFPRQIEASLLEELFESVEASLQFDIENIQDEQVRNQCREALSLINNAREENNLNLIYQKLYVHWLKKKDD
jgi:hypothetical protein